MQGDSMDINFDDVVVFEPAPYTAVSFTRHERIVSSMNEFGTVIYGHAAYIRLHVYGVVDNNLVAPPKIDEMVW